MIFPDWGSTVSQPDNAPLPLYTEWAVDWTSGAFALRDGQPYTVSGADALKIWIACALHPESRRFAFSAHTADYGNTLTELMGSYTDRGILENLLRREIQETLTVSPYITAVDGFSFSVAGSRMTVRFSVHTIYETFQQEVTLS